jgi:transcriptional regulator with XRE-family HTH domain
MWTPEKIKELRTSKGYSQSRLAEACGVTVTTVSRWETGLRSPDNRACRALDVIVGDRVAVQSGVCGWCGKSHGTDAEARECNKLLQEFREYVANAEAEKKSLKKSGQWNSLISLAEEISTECDWHLASTIDALTKRAAIYRRNAEEIVGEVFRSASG